MIGIALTIGFYVLALYIRKLFKSSLLNSVLVAAAFIITVIQLTPLSYELYNEGGQLIGNSLGPVVVLLAIPLYRHREAIRTYFIPIIIGILVSISSSILVITLLSKALGLSDEMMYTLIPKSITTPMAMEVSDMLSGIPNVTVIAVIITGILGATIAPYVMKFGHIKSDIAKGISIGAASHGIGTSKAMEMSDETGAMSGLAMGLTGVIFVLLTSVYVLVF
jgi:predicted murein hydrolase (TIGR00659 family)